MEIIQILQKIKWSNVVDSNCLQSKNGWKVFYSVELHRQSTSWPPVQLVFWVYKNDVQVYYHGCSNDDQQQIVDAFLDAKHRAHKAEDDANSQAKIEAKSSLTNLLSN